MKIGNVNGNASACADDIALMSRREHETQVMINIAHAFATMEGYKLQRSSAVVFGMISSIPYINTGVMYVLNKCIRVSGSSPLLPWNPPPNRP
jgi:hypothetical protein